MVSKSSTPRKEHDVITGDTTQLGTRGVKMIFATIQYFVRTSGLPATELLSVAQRSAECIS